VGEGDLVVGLGKEAVVMDDGQAFCCMGSSIRGYLNRVFCLKLRIRWMIVVISGGDVETIIGNQIASDVYVEVLFVAQYRSLFSR
jgi:hypothetical protein